MDRRKFDAGSALLQGIHRMGKSFPQVSTCGQAVTSGIKV